MNRVPVEHVRAAVFDTDGVITRTATVHGAAWKEMFDAFLHDRAAAAGQPFVTFSDDDYRRYVDGRARADGVEAFLAARGINLPRGDPDDPPDRDTVWGLGNRKNLQFLAVVRDRGVEPFEGTLGFVRRLRELRVPTAVVSASENCAAILEAAGATGLFDVRVDGVDAAALRLPGKPDPALFLEATRRLQAEPQHTAVVEDAYAGVEAGQRGGFGLVVGVDRNDEAEALLAHGADIVVPDLAELVVDDRGSWTIRASGDSLR